MAQTQMDALARTASVRYSPHFVSGNEATIIRFGDNQHWKNIRICREEGRERSTTELSPSIGSQRHRSQPEPLILSDHRFGGGIIRKLWPSETDKLRDHLLRLDKETRRLRFAHGVSDAFVADYASRMSDMGSIVYGYFLEGTMRGAAELRKLGDVWGQNGEAAFSVERPFQENGVGTELMGRVIRSARNRGVRLLYMSCLADNRKMQAVARKHDAALHLDFDEMIGEILPSGPDYFSVMAEALEDRVGYLLAVLDLQVRIVKAA